MRNAGGYGIIVDPDNPTIEFDTFTCAHCNCIVPVKPPPAEMTGGFCRMCMKSICDPCCDNPTCVPFEKRLLLAERSDKFFKALDSWGT